MSGFGPNPDEPFCLDRSSSAIRGSLSKARLSVADQFFHSLRERPHRACETPYHSLWFVAHRGKI